MRIPLYQVDAFTSRLFGGNPAAVCPLAEWLSETTMQSIAAENNLAETAFFVAQGEGYLLRWFTPTVEGRALRPRDARLGLCRDAYPDARPSFSRVRYTQSRAARGDARR